MLRQARNEGGPRRGRFRNSSSRFVANRRPPSPTLATIRDISRHLATRGARVRFPAPPLLRLWIPVLSPRKPGSSCENRSAQQAAKLSFVSAPKPARAPDVDAVLAAFDNARPLDEPLSPEEIVAIEEAMAAPGPGLKTEELLERLRPKT